MRFWKRFATIGLILSVLGMSSLSFAGTWLQTDSTNRYYKLSQGEKGTSAYNNYSTSIDNLFNKLWRDNVINVKSDYSATGDGVTDDTTAIQNAIDAVPSYGAVLVPAGTYKVTSSLNLKSDMTFILLGKLYVSSDTALDGVLAASNKTNLSIVGYGTGQIVGPGTSTNEVQAVYLTSVDHFLVDGLYIEGVASGVSVYNCDFGSISNISTKSVRGQYADASVRGNTIQVYGCTYVDISNISAEDNWKVGIYLSYGGTIENRYINIDNVSVKGTSGSGVSSGIALRAAMFVNVNNVATNNTDKGILIEHYSSSGDGNHLQHINISNLVSNVPAYGILVNDDATGYNIKHLTITNSNVYGATDRAIYMRDVTDWQITAGQDVSATNYSIYLDGVEEGQINGYRSVEAGKEAVYLTGSGADFKFSDIIVRNASYSAHNTYSALYVGASISRFRLNGFDVEATNAALAHKYAIENYASEITAKDVNSLNEGTAVLYNGASANTKGVEFMASTTWNPASINNASYETKSVTVTGAEVGDLAVAGFTQMATGWQITAQVVSANTVEVKLWNYTGGAVDLASGTLYVTVTTQ